MLMPRETFPSFGHLKPRKELFGRRVSVCGHRKNPAIMNSNQQQQQRHVGRMNDPGDVWLARAAPHEKLYICAINYALADQINCAKTRELKMKTGSCGCFSRKSDSRRGVTDVFINYFILFGEENGKRCFNKSLTMCIRER